MGAYFPLALSANTVTEHEEFFDRKQAFCGDKWQYKHGKLIYFLLLKFTLPQSQIPSVCLSVAQTDFHKKTNQTMSASQRRLPLANWQVSFGGRQPSRQASKYREAIDIVIEQEVLLKQILEHLWDNSIWIPNESASPIREPRESCHQNRRNQ